jgi:hypothetical protein
MPGWNAFTGGADARCLRVAEDGGASKQITRPAMKLRLAAPARLTVLRMFAVRPSDNNVMIAPSPSR